MDPLDGDPVVLSRTGQRYRETAAAIRSAVSSLNEISQRGPMVSVAIDRVRRDAAQLAAEIGRAEGRYSETGEALSEYAEALQSAQERAEQAIGDHGEAVAEQRAARSRVSDLRSDRDDAEGTDAASDLTRIDQLLGAALGAVSEAAGDAASARRRYDDAVADRDRAARRAMSRIHDVVEGSDLNDSFWDDVGGVLDDVRDFLVDVLEAIVSAVLAVIVAVAVLVVAVLAVVAAVLLVGLVILAALVLAVLTLAVLALVIAALVIVLAVAALIVIGLVTTALALLALVLGRVLVGLTIFVFGLVWGVAINLLRGMDPMQALVQAAVPALLVAFPELWKVIELASAEERGTPEFVGSEGVTRRADNSIDAMFDDLIAIDAAGHHDQQNLDVNHESVVRIIPFEGPNGEIVYRVHIPSTQQWTPGGTSGNDVTSDVVAKMDPAQQTQLEKMVVDAMRRAGIKPGDHVMLAGWSLGGITAGNLAADPAFTSTYKVDAIAVAGSSVDDLDIPHTVRVLDVSHTIDPVPRTENPFSPDHSGDPNRYKIDFPSGHGLDQVGHNATYYQDTVRAAVAEGGTQAGRDFLAHDPDADDGVQVSHYFGTPARVDQDGNRIGGADYAYTRGE